MEMEIGERCFIEELMEEGRRGIDEIGGWIAGKGSIAGGDKEIVWDSEGEPAEMGDAIDGGGGASACIVQGDAGSLGYEGMVGGANEELGEGDGLGALFKPDGVAEGAYRVEGEAGGAEAEVLFEALGEGGGGGIEGEVICGCE